MTVGALIFGQPHLFEGGSGQNALREPVQFRDGPNDLDLGDDRAGMAKHERSGCMLEFRLRYNEERTQGRFAMGHPRYTADEIVTRGREIYEKQLRNKLEPGNIGKFLVIDIETGDYEMDDDDLIASKKASRKHPGAARYGMRIGYPTSGTIGYALAGAER